MQKAFNEITSLQPLDIVYVGERHKRYFNYPPHCHADFEINFVENASGAKRIIGDSIETIGDLDLVLMTGAKLVHVWEQGDCHAEDIHEITIHIIADAFPQSLLDKHPFTAINRLIQRAQRGVAFSEKAIRAARKDILALTKDYKSFDATLRLLSLLNHLAYDTESRELSSEDVEAANFSNEDQRITQVKEYFSQHYSETIRMETVATLICMTPEGFTRFFHQHTGKTPSRFLIDYRIGIAAKMLKNTQESISEISFRCGFNTLSHFNRLFREAKGCTPKEFRKHF